jgi:hypothetical protein
LAAAGSALPCIKALNLAAVWSPFPPAWPCPDVDASEDVDPAPADDGAFAGWLESRWEPWGDPAPSLDAGRVVWAAWTAGFGGAVWTGVDGGDVAGAEAGVAVLTGD